MIACILHFYKAISHTLSLSCIFTMSVVLIIITSFLSSHFTEAVTANDTDVDSKEFDYDENIFDDKEFEYFYNLELLIAKNDTNINETILLELAEEDLEYEDTTELDIILDKLLEEGDLIDEVLDEIEDEISRTTVHMDDSFSRLLNLILFYVFLISFVVMFIISTVFTVRHFQHKKKSNEGEENHKEEVEFIFFPVRKKNSSKIQQDLAVV